MARSPLQKGPATDHYHDRLGVDQTNAGGGVSATDGRTTVDPATGLRFPSGTLLDLGDGVAGVGLLLQKIGPFHVTFQSDGINASGDGHFLVALAAGTEVLQHIIVPTIAWHAVSGTIDLAVYIGGSHYGPPDDDFRIIGIPYADGELNPRTGGGSTAGLAQVVYGEVSEVGALLVQTASDNLDAGAADIYAIIATPIA